MSEFLAFRVGDIFPAEDRLARWLATIAMAFNDLALVHDRLDKDRDVPYAFLYWLRVAIAHFAEAGLYLAHTRDIHEVKAYLASLDQEVQTHYADCITIFEERRKELFSLRNDVFHYPELAKEDMAKVLSGLAGSEAMMKTGTVRDARLLFADDFAATLFARKSGVPWEEVQRDEILHQRLGEIHAHIERGISAFMRFANPTLMEHLGRQVSGGAEITEVEPVDPQDWTKGWKAVGK